MGQSDGTPEFNRRQVAELIQAAARAGWTIGDSGAFRAAPEPVIEWPGGVPQIIGWREEVGTGGTA